MNVRSIFESRDGALWLAAEKQASRLTRSGIYEEVLGTSTDTIINVLSGAEDSHGRVWFGTANNGVHYWQAGKMTKLPDPKLETIKGEAVQPGKGELEFHFAGLSFIAPQKMRFRSKHKVLQILVNLIRNAKHACQDSRHPEKVLTVRVFQSEGGVKILIIDNGVGIPPENLVRIFNHGFTTRKDGHGFGLHSGALTAKEMGGSLTAQSEGTGTGATFTLELPLAGESDLSV